MVIDDFKTLDAHAGRPHAHAPRVAAGRQGPRGRDEGLPRPGAGQARARADLRRLRVLHGGHLQGHRVAHHRAAGRRARVGTAELGRCATVALRVTPTPHDERAWAGQAAAGHLAAPGVARLRRLGSLRRPERPARCRGGAASIALRRRVAHPGGQTVARPAAAAAGGAARRPTRTRSGTRCCAARCALRARPARSRRGRRRRCAQRIVGASARARRGARGRRRPGATTSRCTRASSRTRRPRPT